MKIHFLWNTCKSIYTSLINKLCTNNNNSTYNNNNSTYNNNNTTHNNNNTTYNNDIYYINNRYSFSWYSPYFKSTCDKNEYNNITYVYYMAQFRKACILFSIVSLLLGIYIYIFMYMYIYMYMYVAYIFLHQDVEYCMYFYNYIHTDVYSRMYIVTYIRIYLSVVIHV